MSKDKLPKRKVVDKKLSERVTKLTRLSGWLGISLCLFEVYLDTHSISTGILLASSIIAVNMDWRIHD